MKRVYLLIGIIFILLIVGGLFAWQKTVKAPGANPRTPKHQPIAQPMPSTPQAPKDWKTYRNEEYGFEIKYPPNYEVKHFQDTDTFLIEKQEGQRNVGLIISIRGLWQRGITGEQSIVYALKKDKIYFGTVTALKYTVTANEEPYDISVRDFQGIKSPKWKKNAEIFLDITPDTIKTVEQILSNLRFLD